MLMSSADYRESLRRFGRGVRRSARRVDSVADEPALAPGINAIGVTYDFARDPEHAPLMLRDPGKQRPHGQPHAAYRRDHRPTCSTSSRRCAWSAGTAAAPSATSPTTRSTPSARRRTASTPTQARRLPRALRRLPASGAGRGPDARRRHDRRQGRPLQAPAPSRPSPDTYVRIVERQARRHRHPRHQGDRHRRALRARACWSCRAAAWRERTPTSRLLRGAARRPRHHHRGAAGRAARRERRRCSPAAMASRPASSSSTTSSCRDERVFLAGEWEHAGFLASHLRDPPPPQLHRRACRLRRPVDRRRRADVARPTASTPSQHGHIRDAMVELIKIVEGFFACGVAASVYGRGRISRQRPAGRRLRQHRQAAAGDPDLRHAAAGARRLRRAGGRAARTRRGPQPGDRRDASPPCWRGRPDIPGGAAHAKWRAAGGPDRVLPARLVLGDQPARRRLAGGDEAGDLAALSGRQTRSRWSRACSNAASPPTPRRPRRPPARPLLRHRLPSRGIAAADRRARPAHRPGSPTSTERLSLISNSLPYLNSDVRGRICDA